MSTLHPQNLHPWHRWWQLAETAPRHPFSFVGVGLFAAMGALARLGLGAATPSTGAIAQAFILLVINVAGCALMARVRHPFLATGFCGGFTSFSSFISFSVALNAMGQDSSLLGLVLGSGYLLLTAVACVGAYLLCSPRRLA